MAGPEESSHPSAPPQAPAITQFEWMPMQTLRHPKMDQVMAELEVIQAQIKKDFLQKAVPPIRLMTAVPPNNPQGIFSSVPFHIKGDPSLPDGVYLFKGNIDKLSVQELKTIVLHEYGHHFLNHADRRAIAKGSMSDSDYLKFRRVTECEADHFTSHYLPEASGMMKTTLQKLIARPLGFKMPENSGYPEDLTRVQMMELRDIAALMPGKVHFDASCRFTPGTIEAPVVPGLPANGSEPARAK